VRRAAHRTLAIALALVACRAGEHKDVTADTVLTRGVRAAPDSGLADSAAADSAARIDSAARADSSATATPDSSPTTTRSPDAHSSRTALLTRDDSIAGNLVYLGRGRCFTCHNQQGEGVPRVGPSLIDREWLDSDGSLAGIYAAVANGVATPSRAGLAMPSFRGQLTAREMHDVAAYIYMLSHSRAPTDGARTALPDSSRRSDTRPAASPSSPLTHA
jgi:mono/diheme cytochrome c family protein